MDDDLRRYREREAQRLLNEPLLVEAFARLEQETFEEILGTRVWWRFGQAKRNALVERVRVIRETRNSLRRIIEAGKARQNSRDLRVV